MLRYLLLKLPGIATISDAVPTPTHNRFIRSLSPVRSIPPTRFDTRRDKERKDHKQIHRRSYSFPAVRPNNVNSYIDRSLLSYQWPDVDRKGDGIIQRQDLHNRINNHQLRNVHSTYIQNSKEFSNNETRVDSTSENTNKETNSKFGSIGETTAQYELEAAKPKRSRSEIVFNVFEYMEKLEKKHTSLEYLQPNNLKPFGSFENNYYPIIITSKSNTQRLPGRESASPVKSGDKDYEDGQRRNYSTINSLDLRSKLPTGEIHKTFQQVESRDKHMDKVKASEVHEEIDNVLDRKFEDQDQVKKHTTSSSKSELLHMVSEPKKCTTYSHELVSAEIAIEPPPFKCKDDSDVRYQMEKRPTTVIDENRLKTPWPAYSETLKEIKIASPMQHPLQKINETREAKDIIERNLHTQRRSLSMDNSRHIQKKHKENVSYQGNRISLIGNNVQKRTITTEPKAIQKSKNPENYKVFSKTDTTIIHSKTYIRSNNFSRQSKPECEQKPKKCFLPSKLRIKPTLSCNQKPQYDCKLEEPCPPRADDCMVSMPKKLPLLNPVECPTIQPKIPDKNPKLRRLKFKFQDPPRICPCDPCPCERADDNLTVTKKKLKPNLMSDCECVEAPPLKDVPLVRLKKICVPEKKCYPQPECPKEEPCVRSDDNLVEHPKILPSLNDSTCPCLEPYTPDKMPHMRRLKFEFKDVPRECPCEPNCPCPPRADDGLNETPKKLPLLKLGDCKCIEQPPMTDVPLKRLTKHCEPEVCYPKKECPVETCEDKVRADDSLKERTKSLPILQPSECICLPQEVPDKAPTMKRLHFEFKDEPRVCPCEPNCPCPPRADELAPKKPKKLKQYVGGDCECVEPPPLIDVPLVRLQKICIPEEKCKPVRECPKEEPCIRADDGMEEKPKKLPSIEVKECPSYSEPILEAPKLKRLYLKAEDPPRVCPDPCVCGIDCPRADDLLKDHPKKLPKIRIGDCPCIENHPQTDVRLKRLKCIDPPDDQCLTQDPCVDYPRADWGCWEYHTPEEKIKKKSKKNVNMNTKRKYNTDSKVTSLEEIKTTAPKNVDIGPKLIKNTKTVDLAKDRTRPNRKMKYMKSPTVDLLNELKELEKKPTRIKFDAVKETKLDINKILSKIPTRDTEIEKPLIGPKLRKLIGDSIAQESSRPMSTSQVLAVHDKESKSNKPKKSKVVAKKIKPCNRSKACTKVAMAACSGGKCIAECSRTKTYTCCQKKASPYPAFSEVMDEEIEPFTQSTEWTCNRKEYGFQPNEKSRIESVRDKKTYSTNAFVKLLLDQAPDNLESAQCFQMTKCKSTTKLPDNIGQRLEDNDLKEPIPRVNDPRKNSQYSSNNTRQAFSNIACYPVEDKYSQLLKQKSNFGIMGMDKTNTIMQRGFRTIGSNEPKCLSITNLDAIEAYSNTDLLHKPHSRSMSNFKGNKGKRCGKKKNCSNKKCPKFKFPNCPEKISRDCTFQFPPVQCKKSPAPYSAFSDCLDEELSENLSECPLEKKKVDLLQPKYMEPLETPNLVQKVEPIIGKMDLKKEDKCIREKLNIPQQGLSQDCEHFGDPIKPLKSRDYFHDRHKDCEKFDKLNRDKTYPKKNTKTFCTLTTNYFNIHKRGMCKVTGNRNNLLITDKEEQKSKLKSKHGDITSGDKMTHVRKYHLLCNKPKKTIEQMDNRKDLYQHQLNDNEDSFTCPRLRNVQWRINNFQKWHRLNKLCSQPGTLKRYYSCSKIPYQKYINISQSRQTFSTTTSLTDITVHHPQRRISTTLILGKSDGKNSFSLKRNDLPNSCPSFSVSKCPSRKQFDCKKPSMRKGIQKPLSPYPAFSECNEEEVTANFNQCPVEQEKLKKLQPQYSLLPEIGLTHITPPNVGKFDPTIEIEYVRRKLGIKNEGLTQDCKTFGQRVKAKPSGNDMEMPKVLNQLSSIKKKEKPENTESRVQNYDRCPNKQSRNFRPYSAPTPTNKIPEEDCKFSRKKCEAVLQVKEACAEKQHHMLGKCTENFCKQPMKHDRICDTTSPKSTTPLKHSDENDLSALWKRIVNYFKARPNCPAPDEWKKKALRERAEKAAKAAGLVLCDPKDLPPSYTCKAEELPKVITPECHLKEERHLCEQQNPCNVLKNKHNIQSEQKRSYSTSSKHNDELRDNRDGVTRTVDVLKSSTKCAHKRSFITVTGDFCSLTSKRCYSRKAFRLNLKEINDSLEEEEKKRLSKKMVEPYDNEDNDCHGFKNFENYDENLNNVSDNNCNGNSVIKLNDTLPYNFNILPRNASFLDIIFNEPLDQFTGYSQAKAFATFQEYFGKIEAISDISYEETEKAKTNNLLSELDKLIMKNGKEEKS